MTLLVDNQLPMALARHLSALGCECIHVRDVGLDEATDHSIWEYAKARNLAMVTLAYEQRKGVPMSCFGETEYFDVGVKKVAQ